MGASPTSKHDSTRAIRAEGQAQPSPRPSRRPSRWLVPHVRPSRGDVVSTLVCLLALSGILIVSSMYSRSIAPVANELAGLPSSFRQVLLVVWYALLAIVSYYRPRVFTTPSSCTAGVIVSALFVACLLIGSQTQSTATFAVGIILYTLAQAWMNFLFACRLTSLPSLKMAAVAAVGGVVLRQLTLPIYSLPLGFTGNVACIGAICVAITAVLGSLNAPMFASLARKESLDQVALTNPLSSLRPPNLLFAGVLLVSLTYNFSAAQGVPGFGALRVTVVLLMLALLYLLLILRDGQEDRLFSLVVLFVMTGLLCTPLLLGQDSYIPNTFLFLGSTCFDVLLWLLIYGIGRRNAVAMIPVFGAICCLDELGNCVGGPLGRLALSLAGSTSQAGQAVTLGLALFFFAFVWLGFKRFSFTEAIRGVESVEEPLHPAPRPTSRPDEKVTGAGSVLSHAGYGEPSSDDPGAAGDAPAPADAHGDDHLGQRCHEMALAVGLTPREEEVFDLLARGRNARYIMDALHVTRNTAKAHIAHIYAKVGVHSHQELLSLVEDGGDQ